MDPVTVTPTKPRDYAALSATYGALLGAVVLAARDQGEEPIVPAEIVPLGVAAFALTKVVAREKVETWMREPFVAEHPDGERRPKGSGMRYAVGELLTCTHCLGAWSALGLVGLRVTRPREARLVTAVLGTSAVNDFLQTLFTLASAQSNVAAAEAQSRA